MSQAPPPPSAPPRRGFLAHTSRAVYGTIIATAVVASTASSIEDWGTGQFLSTLVATLLVLWFAEIYSDVLGDRSDDTLRVRIRRAADEHWAVLECGVPLGIPLVLGLVGVLSEEQAVWGTLIVAVVALATWGGIAARVRGSAPIVVGLAAVASALIGVLIIILKAWH